MTGGVKDAPAPEEQPLVDHEARRLRLHTASTNRRHNRPHMATDDPHNHSRVKLRGTPEALSGKRDVLSDMASTAATGNLGRLQLGKLYDELTLRHDFGYPLVEEYMRRVHGVQLPTKSTMSKLRTVYRAWHLRGRVPLDELAKISISTLYEVDMQVSVTHHNARSWVQRCVDMNREDVVTAARLEAGRLVSLSLSSIRVQADVAELFNTALTHFQGAVGQGDLTRTAFMEFLSQLVLDSERESLRSLWARLHGETIE